MFYSSYLTTKSEAGKVIPATDYALFKLTP